MLLVDENQNEHVSQESIPIIFNTAESLRANEDENQRLINKFRTKGFEELNSFVHKKQKLTDQRIEQLLNVRDLPKDQIPARTTNGNSISNEKSEFQINNFNYPELFIYQN